jgi:outer membrane protein TolC
MRRHLPLFFAALTLGSAARSVAGAPVIPSIPAAAAEYVNQALGNNLGLQGQTLELDRARARLAALRGALQPRLDLTVRYSLADGGRTIDFPAGDLLNGAYRTLNDYLRSQGQPAAFSPVANQSIALLRDREQETKVRLTQPLYRPEITRGVRASQAGLAAREAQVAAYKRELRLAVLTAYFGCLQAEAAVRILDNAAELTAEAWRVNRELRAADRLTDDRVLRAEADDLAVRQQRAEAERDRHAARNYFNFLLNRDLDALIVQPAPAELAALTHELLGREPDLAAGIERREELTALQNSAAAAAAGEAATRAKLYPTLGLAVEGGVQGSAYRTGAGANFVQGSLVAEVNLWDGRQQRSALTEARVDRRRAELDLEETRLQLALQLHRASDNFRAAITSYQAAEVRHRALDRAFELVARREREGVANQLTFLDARNELTRAALNEEITRQRLFTAAAELDRAAALSPLP